MIGSDIFFNFSTKAIHPMSSQQDGSLEHVVENIEAKLGKLEEKRADIRHQIELKRAQIHKLNKTLEIMRDFEDQLDEEQ